MEYSERHKKYPNTIVISYPLRWGGQFKDHRYWLAEYNGEVWDYDTKKHLIQKAISDNMKYVVLRVHNNFEVSIMEKG